MTRFIMRPLAAGAGLLALALITAVPALAQDNSIDVGTKVPSADDIKQGLFPDDECEQLKAAGFKCMGFKPPVRFSLPAVSFKLGSAELPDPVKHQLDAFADVLRTRQNVDRKVRVEGHADASGDAASNQELSQRRADAAKQYLVDKGVKPELINAVGMGTKSLKDARNPTAPENRRVVIGRDGEPN
jgi:outer membrane protein OmpA-like peptidoglycan-associated protein